MVSCLECKHYLKVEDNDEVIDSCEVVGALPTHASFWEDRLSVCCNSNPCSTFDYVIYLELEELAEKCKYFKNR